jgi:hypothetical protein
MDGQEPCSVCGGTGIYQDTICIICMGCGDVTTDKHLPQAVKDLLMQYKVDRTFLNTVFLLSQDLFNWCIKSELFEINSVLNTDFRELEVAVRNTEVPPYLAIPNAKNLINYAIYFGQASITRKSLKHLKLVINWDDFIFDLWFETMEEYNLFLEKATPEKI